VVKAAKCNGFATSTRAKSGGHVNDIFGRIALGIVRKIAAVDA
jgi:hypothetical protein